MPTLLLKNCEHLATFDDQQREIKLDAVFICDNVIEQVGKTNELPDTADKVIDMTNHVVMPDLSWLNV